jgi:hypothetical protein
MLDLGHPTSVPWICADSLVATDIAALQMKIEQTIKDRHTRLAAYLMMERFFASPDISLRSSQVEVSLHKKHGRFESDSQRRLALTDLP